MEHFAWQVLVGVIVLMFGQLGRPLKRQFATRMSAFYALVFPAPADFEDIRVAN